MHVQVASGVAGLGAMVQLVMHTVFYFQRAPPPPGTGINQPFLIKGDGEDSDRDTDREQRAGEDSDRDIDNEQRAGEDSGSDNRDHILSDGYKSDSEGSGDDVQLGDPVDEYWVHVFSSSDEELATAAAEIAQSPPAADATARLAQSLTAAAEVADAIAKLSQSPPAPAEVADATAKVGQSSPPAANKLGQSPPAATKLGQSPPAAAKLAEIAEAHEAV